MWKSLSKMSLEAQQLTIAERYCMIYWKCCKVPFLYEPGLASFLNAFLLVLNRICGDNFFMCFTDQMSFLSPYQRYQSTNGNLPEMLVFNCSYFAIM